MMMSKTTFSLAVTLLISIAIFSVSRYLVNSGVEIIPITTGATGPESFAFGPDGSGPFTGVSDGRILKWEENQWLEYAVVSPPNMSEKCRGSRDLKREHLCGRPLGLLFHNKTGDLYIADAYFGLMKVSPGEKFAQPVATGAEGHPFMFLNGLDIDQENDVIYFTDSSMIFPKSELEAIINSGDNTGRLLKYEIRTKQVQVLLRNLHFPNGVQLNKDASFLVIAETSTNRIMRYWLLPPHAGLVEMLVELDGEPDNIKLSPRGGFWVGVDGTQPAAGIVRWVRDFVIGFGFGELVVGKALAVRVSESGEVIDEFEPFGNEKKGMLISEVVERNGVLWIGSAVSPFVGVCMIK